MADAQTDRLTRLEAEISGHRMLYLRAIWAGHQGEADWHETETDRLLGLWQQARAGRLPDGGLVDPG